MFDLLAELQGREILRASDMERLKRYIFEKYPGYETADRAEVLAQAVRSILNRELSMFDATRRGLLRQAILKEAVQEKEFHIRASHVFLSAVWLEEQGINADYSALTDWVNQQALAISQEDLRAITREIVQHGIQKFEDLSASEDAMEHTKLAMSIHQAQMQAKETIHTHRLGRFQLPGVHAHRACLALSLLAFLVIPTVNHLIPESQVKTLAPTTIHQYPSTQIQGISRGGTVHASFFLPNRRDFIRNFGFNTSANERTEQVIKQSLPALASVAAVIGEKDLDKLLQANELPPELRYQQIDREQLLDFLSSRDSILVDESYFNTILEIAQQTDINPLLLFAITGQEQSFVPRTHANALLIANNPYNVFQSWEVYNTNITDTTWITCRTIIYLSQGCPEGVDPLRWINRSYAEDPNWCPGVTRFLQTLQISTSKIG